MGKRWEIPQGSGRRDASVSPAVGNKYHRSRGGEAQRVKAYKSFIAIALGHWFISWVKSSVKYTIHYVTQVPLSKDLGNKFF